MLLLAFVAGWWLARVGAKRNSVAPRHVDNVTLLIALTSLFGARFFSWLFYFPPGVGFVKAMTMGGGGMVFYGGLLFGIATLLAYCVLTRLDVRKLLDVFAAPAALGLALGRIGCFLAGCCWGDVCTDSGALTQRDSYLRYQIQTLPFVSQAGFPLAVTFPRGAGAYEQHQNLQLIASRADRSAPVHPVQLYEAALVTALGLLLWRTFRQNPASGTTAVRLVIGYALIRFTTEFFRADNEPVYWGLTLSQVIGLIMAAAAAGLLRLRQRQPVQRKTDRIAQKLI